MQELNFYPEWDLFVPFLHLKMRPSLFNEHGSALPACCVPPLQHPAVGFFKTIPYSKQKNRSLSEAVRILMK